MNNVIINITERWEKGIPHHPKSIEIFKVIKENGWKYGGDYFRWKSGGDGDSGEHLMYLLDIHFERGDYKMTMPELIAENESVLDEEISDNRNLDVCEMCGKLAWDGRICHSCGMELL